MVSEMKDTRATKAEYVYVSEIKKSHENFFNELQNCFTENSYSNVFINAIIGDYLYDINQKYKIREESFRQFIISNWCGDLKDYCDSLVESVNDAKKIVINTYFLILTFYTLDINKTYTASL